MNTNEKFCVCKETIMDSQLNDKQILQSNKTFEPVLQGEDHTM
jgi:hypothetical protein